MNEGRVLLSLLRRLFGSKIALVHLHSFQCLDEEMVEYFERLKIDLIFECRFSVDCRHGKKHENKI